MTTKYDDAVVELYRAPLDQFVAVRKRLVSELKAAGDKAGATRLAGLARPPISAWTVNQLWWEARETFDELFAAGARLREGDLAATSLHRDAMTKLRSRAEALLGAAGHATTEATLRRTMTDLSALAAVGSFDPDPPGALAADREPPGFDFAAAMAPEATPRNHAPRPAAPRGHERADARAKDAAELARQTRERQERERREQERRKAEEEQARKRAERARLEVALRSAKVDLETRAKEVDRLRSELAVIEKMVTQKRAEITDLEARLAALD
jgi:hypothetical protein